MCVWTVFSKNVQKINPEMRRRGRPIFAGSWIFMRNPGNQEEWKVQKSDE
jgi:hypothetical protein